jgi:hypothetical protein
VSVQNIRDTCDVYAVAPVGLPTHAVYAFPSGIPFTFWEQYLHLRKNLLFALAVTITAVFVVVSVLLMSPWTAAIVVGTLLIMVVEMGGFMGTLHLHEVSTRVMVQDCSASN